MQKRELTVRSGMNQAELREIITTWAKRYEVVVKPMGRLTRSYKSEGDSMHWHVSGMRRGMGTVEVTYLPSNGKLAVMVHDNRRGSWAGRAYLDLAREIRQLAS